MKPLSGRRCLLRCRRAKRNSPRPADAATLISNTTALNCSGAARLPLLFRLARRPRRPLLFESQARKCACRFPGFARRFNCANVACVTACCATSLCSVVKLKFFSSAMSRNASSAFLRTVPSARPASVLPRTYDKRSRFELSDRFRRAALASLRRPRGPVPPVCFLDCDSIRGRARSRRP